MVEIEEEENLGELSVTELKRMKEAEVITGTCQHTHRHLPRCSNAPHRLPRLGGDCDGERVSRREGQGDSEP